MKKFFRFISCCLFFILSVSVIFAQEKPDALKKYSSGAYAEAVSICLEEISVTPKNIDSYVVLSWALLRLKRYDEVISWVEKGREYSQYEPRLIESQGEACYYKGQNDKALKLFQDYIAYAPNGARRGEVYYFMGEIYLRQGRYNHADIALTVAVQYEDNNAKWFTRLGYAREMAKDKVYALNAYEKALALDSSQIDARRGQERLLNTSSR